MHRELKTLLEDLLKEEGIESTTSAKIDTAVMDKHLANAIQYPGSDTLSPRLRRNHGSDTKI